MAQDRAVAGWEVGCSRGPLRLALWCSLAGGGEKRERGVDWRGQGGINFLLEEMEACAVFPLRVGYAYAGFQNPAPPDAAVGGPYENDFYSSSTFVRGVWRYVLASPPTWLREGHPPRRLRKWSVDARLNDLRNLNKKLKRKPCSMTNISEMLLKWEGFKFSMSLGLNMIY